MISTNIPLFLRPGVYLEVDNSRALGGVFLARHRVLLLGQKLAGGTATINEAVRILSEAQAEGLFGKNSMLHRMVRAARGASEYVELWAMPQVDNVAGVNAAGSVTFAGPATAAGTLNLYVGGDRIQVAVPSGMTSAQLATATNAAIIAAGLKPVSTAVDGGNTSRVNLTALHKGECGNGIDIRVNHYDGEALPAGITATIVAMTGGTANPDLAPAIAALGPTPWSFIATPYVDAANLALIEAELAARFGPTKQIEGQAFSAVAGSLGTMLALGNSRNSPHVTILGVGKAPTTTWQAAAAFATVAAYYAGIDPARPLQTLALSGMMAPRRSERLTDPEREQLLVDGVATYVVDDAGVCRIERAVTTFQTDASYRDTERMLLLMALRYDLRVHIPTKYPRHKLADNGTRFGLGQAVVTPNDLRDELWARFTLWEERGWVEDFEQFKRDCIVERSADDSERVNAVIPPNCINGFRTFAGVVQFRI